MSVVTWFWIGILVLTCAILGGYVYLAEYRGGSFEPASAEHGEQTARRGERPG